MLVWSRGAWGILSIIQIGAAGGAPRSDRSTLHVYSMDTACVLEHDYKLTTVGVCIITKQN